MLLVFLIGSFFKLDAHTLYLRTQDLLHSQTLLAVVDHARPWLSRADLLFGLPSTLSKLFGLFPHLGEFGGHVTFIFIEIFILFILLPSFALI